MKKVGIIFGGKSGEHEVSVNSALSIEREIDRTKFTTQAIGISHQGKWLVADSIEEIIKNGQVIENDQSSLITPKEILDFDVLFPIIHGPNGEDGTLQGLLETLNLPYTGPGVLGSATAMDKVVQKMICAYQQIPQVKYQFFFRHEWENNQQLILQQLDTLQFPLFIKPVNMGSSVGVSKAKTVTELIDAIKEALKYDHKIIVEEGVEPATEIEVAVLGNEKVAASVCGSIQPNTEFYDYETKYLTDDIVAKIPAEIPNQTAQKICQAAVQAFQILGCEGFARVDFLYHAPTQKFYLNEINTAPGFTSISMYPKLWAATGINYLDLITQIIELGINRWKKKQLLSYQYQP